jgi:hypothetical protein
MSVQVSAEKVRLVEEIFSKYFDPLHGLTLYCYSLPRVEWVEMGGRYSRIVTYQYIYKINVRSGGGRTTVEVIRGIYHMGCQQGTVVLRQETTRKEAIRLLADFIERERITEIEVERVVRETAWVDRARLALMMKKTRRVIADG